MEQKKGFTPAQFNHWGLILARISNIVAFQWIQNPSSKRLAKAQVRLEESVRSFGLEPLRYPVRANLVPIGELLLEARRRNTGSAFVWCNSDVVLTRNPFDVPDIRKVFGFHRREVPVGKICSGVDMYYIPNEWWDGYLSADIPKLYLGASYVDWWISRAMQKVDAYENLVGYIDHETHPQSMAAGSDANPYYQKTSAPAMPGQKEIGLRLFQRPPF